MRISKAFAVATLSIVIAGAALAREQAPNGPARTEALQRATQLRAEAAAHREMEQRLAAMKGGSRGERRWRRRMIELCDLYITDALRTAASYEETSVESSPFGSVATLIDPAPPVTAAEYDARAKEYESRAEWLRNEADRHLSMLQSSRTYNVQPRSGAGLNGRASSGFYESPRERTAREQHQDVVQQNLDLARDAEDIAKHYRLRARQLREVSR